MDTLPWECSAQSSTLQWECQVPWCGAAPASLDASPSDMFLCDMSSDGMSRDPRTVVFVCRHGAAKSVLAAADLRRLAAARGLTVAIEAVGLDPDPEVAPAVLEVVVDDRLATQKPRRITPADVDSAWRVITFGIGKDELPAGGRAIESWDDVPAVSDGLGAARTAIGRHLERLVSELRTPDS
jgi:arsenate reductase (thioredoxin)